MPTTRRDFLRHSVSAGGAVALGLGPATHALTGMETDHALQRSPQARPSSAPRSLKLLILGGTSFLGPHQIHYALERGHEVSIFTRGRTQPTIHVEDFQRVEHLTGDRENDLSALEGREWDAVFDNSTRNWEWARDSAQLLKNSVGRYLFISSTGVYYPYLSTDINESVVPLSVDESNGEDGSAAYGVMKTLGEQEAQKAFGDRAILARPQHFTGPGEQTDRHGFWVDRMERGGEVLAMGRKTDPVMLMDVRDLAEFCVHMVETEAGGIFNIAGPGSLLTQEEFLYGLRFCTGADVQWTWVDDYEFLQEQRLSYAVPWTLLEGPHVGYTSINVQKAIAHGLRFRPLAQTHLDTRDWWYSEAVTEERRLNPRFALSPDREKEILMAWKARLR